MTSAESEARREGRPWRKGAPWFALPAVAALASAALADPPAASPPPQPLRFSVLYKLDVMDVASGGAGQGARWLDDLLASADADLGAAIGWRGATVHASLLVNHGGRPGALAGSVQGVDNIEVADPRVKLYEAWLDQTWADGAVDLRVGLYDTNTEFDATDSAGVFLGPTFGISSEIAATGPAGPSIFPSTALAARLGLRPAKDVYLRAAVINAQAGTLGDPGGVDLTFEHGVLAIGEAGWTGRGKIALGAWGYSNDQPAPGPPSAPQRLAASRGAYLMVDEPLPLAADGPQASAFLRVGVSDGETGVFRGAASAGVSLTHLSARRPDDILGLAVSTGVLSSPFRTADPAAPLARAESAVELTYAGKVSDHLTLQPDLQYVRHPSAAPGLHDALVVGLRATLSY